MATSTHLGGMLNMYRYMRKMGVRELAKEIGISAATLSRVERGHEMDLKTFEKFLVWFRSSTDGD